MAGEGVTIGTVDSKSTMTLTVERLAWFGMSEGTFWVGTSEGVTCGEDMEELAVGTILAMSREMETTRGNFI